MIDLPTRKPIGKRVRFDVFKRDGFSCQYCGRTPPAVRLECDHIKPVAEGGDNDPDNLTTACSDCNRGKGAVPLEQVPQALADKAAEIAEREEQLQGYNAILEARRERVEDDIWRVVAHLTGETSIQPARYTSIKRFVEQLGVQEVLDAVDATHSRGLYQGTKSQFLYFCKVCWNKINGEAACG